MIEQASDEKKLTYRERVKRRIPLKAEHILLGQRKAWNLSGANALLDQRAREELGDERHYYVDRAYALYRAGHVEGEKVAGRVFYFEDSLLRVPLPRHYNAHGGNASYAKAFPHAYPPEYKQRALELYREGKLKQIAIAKQLSDEFHLPHVPTQAVHNWVKEFRTEERKQKRSRNTSLKRPRSLSRQ